MKLLFFLLLPIPLLAQHSQRFIELTETLKPIDSSTISEKFKNGNLKETGKTYIYKDGNYLINVFTGKFILYTKSGEISIEIIYDHFKNQLSRKSFNKEGQILNTYKTLKIDTSTKDKNDFFEDKNHLTIIKKYQHFTFDTKSCTYYLKKEGTFIDGKKSGVWITYNPDTTTKKEKVY